jgi:transposase InsO family protein
VFFHPWVSVFGPPEQLLTDLGPNIASGVIAEMCRLIRTKKIFTSAYHQQTNGFIESYSRTLSTELRRHLLDEEDWDLSLSMAVSGSEFFEFDCGLLQRCIIDVEPEDLARRLAEVHAELLRRV